GTTVASALHGTWYPRRRYWCGLGAALSVIGLGAFVLTLDYRGTPLVLAVAALAVIAAAALVWYGATWVTEAPRPEEPGSSGYPLLALPLVGSALATGYQLIEQHHLDPTAMVLAAAGVVIVTIRQMLVTVTL